jgi:hypothetical protein
MQARSSLIQGFAPRFRFLTLGNGKHTIGQEIPVDNCCPGVSFPFSFFPEISLFFSCHFQHLLLSKDWGFYHTVTTNLLQVQNRHPQYRELNDQDLTDIGGKIQGLLKWIEREPKPLGWKLKAKLDPNGKSYRHVKEAAR